MKDRSMAHPMLHKIIVFIFSLLLALAVALGMALWFANTGKGRQVISDTASRIMERKVDYHGSMGLRAKWPPRLSISGVHIANTEDGRADYLADIGMVQVALSPWRLFTGSVKLPYIFVDDSAVHLERAPNGKGNWQLGEGGSDEASTIRLGTLFLRDTTLTFYDKAQNIDLNIAAKTEKGNLIATGDGVYLGERVALHIQGGEVLEAQTDAAYPFDGTLTVGATTLHAEGTIQDPTNLMGMDIRLRVRGEDASELFPLLGIALPPTAPYDVEGKLKFADDIWRFEDFTGNMGNSDLSGDLKWDISSDRPKLTAEFVSQKLDFKDLGPLIGLDADEVTEGNGAEDSPYVIPDVPLDITRLDAMDADVTLTGREVISPVLPLDDFLLHVTLDNRLLTIAPVKFGTANGDIAARMRINARQEPVDIGADFRFRRLSLARLLEGISDTLPAAKEAEGEIGGVARLKGQGKSLKDMLSTADGTIGIGMKNGQLSNLLVELVGLDVAESIGFFIGGDKTVPVHCVIGDFDVTDGIMQSRALVVDTEDTNIQGEGSINLGTEALDLRIVPAPKDMSIASLRTPIRVEGTLKNPDVIIEKTSLIARGVGAVALSAALTPLAAIAALYETGGGEDSDCGALIDAMIENSGVNREASNVPENPAPPQTEMPAPNTEAEQSQERNGTPVKPDMQEDIVTHPGDDNPIQR